MWRSRAHLNLNTIAIKSSIEKSLEALDQFISKADVIRPSVSAASVGWHIEHALLVAEFSVKALQTDLTTTSSLSQRIKKKLFFLVKYIPRKSAKAPKVVRPATQNPEINDLKIHLKEVLEQLQKATEAPANLYFHHPQLGVINTEETLEFIVIHNEHHLKIIRDILA